MKKLICCTVIFIFLSSIVPAQEYTAVDGDSLLLGEQRLRLDGIDAPEFTQNCYTADGFEYACGLKALQYLADLLVEADVRCDCAPKPDIYNRRVCECFADDISLNQAMVYAGYAMSYRSEKYTAAEQNAKSAKRGIWQGKFMRPALYRALERAREKKKQKELSVKPRNE